MAKRDKRLERIRRNPKNIRFDDLRRVLEDHGFIYEQGKGTSHNTFRAEIGDVVVQFTIPYRRPFVKAVYVRRALKRLEAIIELQEGGDDE